MLTAPGADELDSGRCSRAAAQGLEHG